MVVMTMCTYIQPLQLHVRFSLIIARGFLKDRTTMTIYELQQESNTCPVQMFSKGVRNSKETHFHHSRVITPVQELLSYGTNENSSCGNIEQDHVGGKKK